MIRFQRLCRESDRIAKNPIRFQRFPKEWKNGKILNIMKNYLGFNKIPKISKILMGFKDSDEILNIAKILEEV